MSKRNNWSSKIGFVLAGVGSAVGLGAIWKFPYMLGTNGGSALLFPYLVFTLFIGLALLCAELALGRMGRGSALCAFEKIGGRPWKIFGYIAILSGFGIISFYSVIGGWTLSYLFDALTGNITGNSEAALGGMFGGLVSSPLASISYCALFLLVTGIVVAKGIGNGIEALSKKVMPTFFLLVLVIIVRGLTLPGAWDGIEFLFRFNPDDFTADGLLFAMGYTFFSLSLCGGCMITYGSYLDDKTDIVGNSLWITFLATLSSMLGALMIMPTVFASGINPSAGPGLTFITMPLVFSQLPFGAFFAAAFFICLTLAAITSAVALLEIVVSFLVDNRKLPRVKATVLAVAAIFPFSILCALSFGPMADVKILGKNFFDILDWSTSNFLMPIGGTATCLMIGWFCREAVTNHIFGSSSEGFLAKSFVFVMKFVAPAMIFTLLVAGFF